MDRVNCWVRRKGGWAVVGAGLAALVPVAAALADDTPTMGPISFPIQLTSIATSVAVAGGLVLIAYFGVKVGFALVKKLLTRLHRSV